VQVKDWSADKLRVVVAGVFACVLAVCGTVVYVTRLDNERAVREAELQEEARKAKAADDLKAAEVRAEVQVREAEIQSKKRKLWERDAEGVGSQDSE